MTQNVHLKRCKIFVYIHKSFCCNTLYDFLQNILNNKNYIFKMLCIFSVLNIKLRLVTQFPVAIDFRWMDLKYSNVKYYTNTNYKFTVIKNINEHF